MGWGQPHSGAQIKLVKSPAGRPCPFVERGPGGLTFPLARSDRNRFHLVHLCVTSAAHDQAIAWPRSVAQASQPSPPFIRTYPCDTLPELHQRPDLARRPHSSSSRRRARYIHRPPAPSPARPRAHTALWAGRRRRRPGAPGNGGLRPREALL